VGNLVLTREGVRVELDVYTQEVGGNPLAFDGTGNVFANAAIPAGGLPLWVEGIEYSVEMRDTGLKLAAQGFPRSADVAKFTVLSLDTPQLKLNAPQTVSAKNDKRTQYRITRDPNYGNLALGFRRALEIDPLTDKQLNGAWVPDKNLKRSEWAFEVSSLVSPNNFQYKGVKLHLDRDVHALTWKLDLEAMPEAWKSLETKYSNENRVPKGNDTSPEHWRDDVPWDELNPQTNDNKVYDIDAPSKVHPSDLQGTVRRLRFNARSFAVAILGGDALDGRKVRVSKSREYFVRYSIKQIAAGKGKNWVLVTPPDPDFIAGDNQAALGQTPVSWNLQ
jgi:hypothetical protein